MPGLELANKRLVAPIRWGTSYAQPCLAAPCENVLLIDVLEEGDIWGCAKCNARHEFVTEFVRGPGGYLKYGVVHLLIGDHVRTSGEPTITEFMEPAK